MKTLMGLCAALALLGGAGNAHAARDYVWAAGSSTVFPFATRVAENYARKTGMKAPNVESLGTGGGIKLMRAIILYKQVFREVVRAIHPNAIKPVRLGTTQVTDKILHAVLAFSFIYMVTIVSLTLLLSATGLELITAFSAVIVCLNNTGPGLNAVGPASTYAVLNDFQTWVCAFAMLLGRLELFTLIVVLTPAFWRK